MNIAKFLIRLISSKRPELDPTEVGEFVERFCGEKRPGSYGIEAKAVSLAKAGELMRLSGDDEFIVNDFVYSRGMDTVFFNVTNYTCHEIFMGYLYWIETELNTGKWAPNKRKYDTLGSRDWDDGADKFVAEGLGLFQSSAYGMGGILKKGEAFKLNFQEQQVFKGYKLLDIC